MKAFFRQTRFPLILFLCLSLAFPPDLVAQSLAADGKRTSVTELNGTVINWEYDALNRLVTEVHNAPGDANDFEHTYVYDLVGNRLKKQVDGEPDTIYSYNDNDQLTSEITDGNSIYYSYDDNGSLIKEANDVETIRTYTYNLQNRLASLDNGTNVVDYSYNADGIRVKAAVQGGTTTEYLIDSDNPTGYSQVFKEKQGAAETAYIIGLDVLAQATGTADPNYFVYDGHGSVRHLANNSGAIIESYNYDAYGNLHNFSGTPQTNLLYAGEWRDFDSGWDYLRNRWYNPAIGRFNSMDDFSGDNYDPQSLHKYLYCCANPISRIDPSGNFSFAEALTVQTITAIAIASIAPAMIIGYETAKTGASWWEIGRNATIAWGVTFGAGMGFAVAAPYIMAASTTALTLIPGISAGCAKTIMLLAFVALAFDGVADLWMSDYPLELKISVTTVLALSAVVALGPDRIKSIVSGAKENLGCFGKSPQKSVSNPWGRRGSPSHRNRILEIEHRLVDKGWDPISGGSGPEQRVYLPDGSYRYPDLVMGKGTKTIAINVGHVTSKGLPIQKELPAFHDLREVGEFAHVFLLSH